LLLWRDLLLIKNENLSSITFINFSPMSQSASSQLKYEEIYQFIRILENSLDQLNNNLNMRLLLENIMIKWPKINIHS